MAEKKVTYCPFNMIEFRKRYDVFLSFRGEDNRRDPNYFTTNLSNALLEKKIHTFVDEELPKGKAVLPELLKAIESSGCSIIILSENYAASPWCLNELVKILECKETIKHYKVLPIFYRLDPSDVRHQSGAFGKAFERLCKGNEREKVNSWKAALTKVSEIKGWHFQSGDDAKFIQTFVEEVLKENYVKRERFNKWIYVNEKPVDEFLEETVGKNLSKISRKIQHWW